MIEFIEGEDSDHAIGARSGCDREGGREGQADVRRALCGSESAHDVDGGVSGGEMDVSRHADRGGEFGGDAGEESLDDFGWM